MSGPNSFNTPTDFLATACSSASDKLPAPGISRSITNWGMTTSPNGHGSRKLLAEALAVARCVRRTFEWQKLELGCWHGFYCLNRECNEVSSIRLLGVSQ